MKALIGNSLIARLTQRKKQYDVRGTKLVGFLIRINPTGKMYYACQYKRGRRVNLGKVGIITPAQTRDMTIAKLGDIAKGIDPGEKPRKMSNITLREFIDHHYSPWVIEHRKSGSKSLDHIKRCHPIDQI